MKVNIGSGLLVAPGWVNIDSSPNALISRWPRSLVKVFHNISAYKQRFTPEEYCSVIKENIFVHHNIAYGLPFPDQSVDYLYSSHVLEHLLRKDARDLLEEVHRVLKKNGIARICVPDLEHVFSLYQKGEKEEALEFFFADSQSGYFSRHLYMYDFGLLEKLLREAGFSHVEQNSYREGKTPDIEVLDNRPEQTLYVEASK